MSRTTMDASFKAFSKGLVTSLSKVDSVPDSFIEGTNLYIGKDSTLRRRKGMLAHWPSRPVTRSGVAEEEVKSFRWESPGGLEGTAFLVLAYNKKLHIYNTKNFSDSDDGYIQSLDIAYMGSLYSLSSVESVLVLVDGSSYVTTVAYRPVQQDFKISRDKILVRDMFGLEALKISPSGDTSVGLDINYRPTTSANLNTFHNYIYNLRNQSWATPRLKTSGAAVDPIHEFLSVTSTYPSNSDTVTGYITNDPNSTTPLVDKFNLTDLQINPKGSTHAPRGHFIIDLVSRGTSRKVAYQNAISKMRAAYPSIDVTAEFISIGDDYTPQGATVACEYSGRMFFAGFGSETVDGDSRSPSLNSYIAFSQVVTGVKDITQCYQRLDPTDKDGVDILHSDGGVIKISGCDKIVALIPVGKGVAVIATNGVWVVKGGDESGFSASSIILNKITEIGCDSPNSCVVSDGTIFYWSYNSIMSIGTNEFGDLVARSITDETLYDFYNKLGYFDKLNCTGAFDKHNRVVRWVFNNSLQVNGETRELVLDPTTNVFYTNTIDSFYSPKVISIVSTIPYKVTYVGRPITHNSVEAVYNKGVSGEGVTDILYVCAIPDEYTANFSLSLSSYDNDMFRDFEEEGGFVRDAYAYAISGYVHGEDFSRQKQAPVATFLFNKTETGFTYGIDGEIDGVLNPSSCLIQSRWDWSNSPNGGKWGRPFQAYRHNRHYFPTMDHDDYDTGDSMVVTRNKIPGRGRTLSVMVSSSEGKDLQLVGWSLTIGVNNAK